MKIAVTLGDPSGISPEIVVKTVGDGLPDVVVFGDRGVLERAGLPRGATVEVVSVTELREQDSAPGRPSPAGGAAQVSYLEAAVAAARRGEIDAIVTAPISKKQVIAAGFAFPGHTEFLAERLGAAEVAMMFAGPKLRVILATIHVALADVPRALSRQAPGDQIAKAIFLGGRAVAHDFRIARPRIGVLGLNPHAGEQGLFGREEDQLIAPGMELGRARLAAAGIDAEVVGPLVPDAAFRQRFDLFVAMYHDQGLIPVKLIDFDLAVNVTLGLPIVRTSPDHGVAYDIAGQGKARHESLAAALDLARRLVANRQNSIGTASEIS